MWLDMNTAAKSDFRLLVCGGRDYGYRKTPEGKKVRYEPEIAFLGRYLDTFAAHIRATMRSAKTNQSRFLHLTVTPAWILPVAKSDPAAL